MSANGFGGRFCLARDRVRSPIVREGLYRRLPSLTVGLLTLTALRVHLVERQFVLFPIKLFGHPSVDEGEVYRINVRIENDVIEVPNDNRESREHSLVEMDGQRYLDPPACQEGTPMPLDYFNDFM